MKSSGKLSNEIRLIAWISAIIAIGVTSFFTYAIASDNNQGEIYDTFTGAIDWIYLFEITSIWFISTFAPVFVLLFFLTILVRLLTRMFERG